MSAHALLSPSSAHRWMRCAGSLAAIGEPKDDTNEFAMEGTAAHTLGERALTYQKDAEFFRGELIAVDDGKGGLRNFEVDDEMIENVQVYLDQVRREPGELLVEQRLDLAPVYGVDDQFGTGDAVVLDYENERIYVGDLKYGKGVQVYAEDNEQLYSYGAAALMEYDMVAEWKSITVAIHQPRLNHYDEHTLTRAEMDAFIAHAKERAQLAMQHYASGEAPPDSFTPGEKQCQWCPLKGSCGPLAKWAHEQVFDGFTDLTSDPGPVRSPIELTHEELAEIWKRRDMISKWLSEVQAEASIRLEAGVELPGLKLVAGKKGARQWVDPDDAEERLKKARLKQAEMYDMKLISPTTAEKLLKKDKPRVWKSLQAHIKQSDGKPAVAPLEDKRPPLKIAKVDQFADVSEPSGGEDLEAMFG